MATKFSITEENKTTEFSTYEEALSYKTLNGLSCDIDTIEYDPPCEKKAPVNARQIRQALILSGVELTPLAEAFNSIQEPAKSLMQIEWRYAANFERDNPIINMFAAHIGWTSEQVDDLWLLASTL